MLIAEKASDKANSYATVEEADTYHASSYEGGDWGNISLEDKEKLLITATRAIDVFMASSKREPSTSKQALFFPLSPSFTDDGGFRDAKTACIEQALYIFKNHALIQQTQKAATQNIKSETLTDGISITYGDTIQVNEYSQKAQARLDKYLAAQVTYSLTARR